MNRKSLHERNPYLSLLETNPYLKNSEEAKSLIFTSVSSSTAIEGVHITYAELSRAIKDDEKCSDSRSVSKSSVTRQ